MKKVAIVYDRVNKWGGAERVLLALNEIFPYAPLYTSVYSIKSTKWANKFPQVKPTWLNKIRFLQSNHEYLAPLMPLAFESHDFSDYDVVISVTSEAGKSILTSPNTTHICYCLTPTRYLWSGYDDYFDTSINKLVSKPLVKYLRHHDKVAAQRPDVMIAISSEIKSRIKEYYDRDSQIIFPPVDISYNKSTVSTEEYYLIVSRLVRYKKVDLAINAFNKLNKKLIIIGSGHEERYLKSLANKNILFLKNLSDEKLFDYYYHCKALIFPQLEDFGLVAAEAQMLGKPVIAYKAGGALDIVKEDETGVFFESQTVDSLANAVTKFEKTQFDVDIIMKNADKFSKKRFQDEIKKIIYV